MRARVVADSFLLWLKLALRASGVLVFVLGLLPLIAITTLMRDPSTAGNMDSGLVVPLVAIAALPYFLGQALTPADPFVHLLPIGPGERQVATAALLQSVPLAFGALLCLVVGAEERALVAAAVLAAAGSGAFAARLGLAVLPVGLLLFFAAPVLVGIAVNRLSVPALVVVGVATTIGNLVLPQRVPQAAIVHRRRLVDRPRRRRRCSLLRLFLRGDASAWAPVWVLVLFPLFFLWRPANPSFFAFTWVAILAGMAVGRFMSGSAGQMLLVLPVRRRRLVLILAGYLLVSLMLLPVALVAITHAPGDRLASRIASCIPRDDSQRCEESVERQMASVLRTYFEPLPRPAAVRSVDDQGRVEVVPSSVSMAAWRAKMLRGALSNFVFSTMLAGATILVYLLVARLRRTPAVP